VLESEDDAPNKEIFEDRTMVRRVWLASGPICPDIPEEVVGVIVSISMRDGMTEHTPSDFALLRRDALWGPVVLMSQDTACTEGNQLTTLSVPLAGVAKRWRPLGVKGSEEFDPNKQGTQQTTEVTQ